MLHRNTRRSFLKELLGMVGAVSTASVSAGSTADDDKDVTDASTNSERGYRETDHIRDYYRKVNF